jgi:hypothetical protein
MDSSTIHCPIHFYVAKELTLVESRQEVSEDISYFRVPLDEALNMVHNSVITHAASSILIMKAHYDLAKSAD